MRRVDQHAERRASSARKGRAVDGHDDASIPLNLIRHASGNFDLSVVVRLELPGMRLRTIRGLDRCSSLRVLNLCDNLIESIDTLWEGGSLEGETSTRAFGALEHADFRRNRISKITVSPLRVRVIPFMEARGEIKNGVSGLRSLRLDGNCIPDIDSVENLVSIAPRLENISFRPYSKSRCQKGEEEIKDNSAAGINPVCKDDDYVATILKALPDLMFLDWQYVKVSEAAGLNGFCPVKDSSWRLCNTPWLEWLDERHRFGRPAPSIESEQSRASRGKRLDDALAELDDAKVRFHEHLLHGKELISEARGLCSHLIETINSARALNKMN